MATVVDRLCVRCGDPIPEPSRRDRIYCGDRCKMAAHQERQQEATRALVEDPVERTDDQLEQLRQALAEATEEPRLLAVIAAEARKGNWRASAWLLSRLHPSRWGERGREEPWPETSQTADDAFSEIDEIAARRRRKPPGY